MLAPMHDRMPVIVAPAHYERWLDVASDADVTDLSAPYPADAMTWYPVSTRVNSVRNDDATLIEQVAEAAATASAELLPRLPTGTRPRRTKRLPRSKQSSSEMGQTRLSRIPRLPQLHASSISDTVIPAKARAPQRRPSKDAGSPPSRGRREQASALPTSIRWCRIQP